LLHFDHKKKSIPKISNGCRGLEFEIFEILNTGEEGNRFDAKLLFNVECLFRETVKGVKGDPPDRNCFFL
jgi:hypothetical protein